MSQASASEPTRNPIPLNIYVHDFSPVSALVIGAPGSEWILLPKQAAAFWEGHKKSSGFFRRFVGRNRKSRRREAAGRRNYLEAVPNGEGRNGENMQKQASSPSGEKPSDNLEVGSDRQAGFRAEFLITRGVGGERSTTSPFRPKKVMGCSLDGWYR